MKKLTIKGFTDASWERDTKRSRGALLLEGLNKRQVHRYQLHGSEGSENSEYQTIVNAVNTIQTITGLNCDEINLKLFVDCLPAIERYKQTHPEIAVHIDFQYIKGTKNPAHVYCKLPKRGNK